MKFQHMHKKRKYIVPTKVPCEFCTWEKYFSYIEISYCEKYV